MAADVTLDVIYTPSEDVVFRDIEGELIIVPLTSEVGGAFAGQSSLETPLRRWLGALDITFAPTF